MAVLETVALAKTTTQDGFVAFADDDLWVVDGIFTVSTAALTVGATQGAGAGAAAAGTPFANNAQWGVKLINLRQMLVRPTTAGVHGTLTFFGTVVDRAGLNELLRSKLGAT